ncbi:MAG: hypothetical protein JNL02_02950 [Saprospiraceae bacterium]|nr:hypothetical protein [Saprospiraceae bacterium]
MSNPSFEVASPTEYAVLRTLHYFAIFRHPLQADEVLGYINLPLTTQEDVTSALRELEERDLVFCFDGYYQVENNPEWLSARLASNRRAEQFMPMARRMSRFIGGFPFVRSVFVSGSLSKGCMAPDGDIDFFIITHPGRLWLARTLLVIFKKIFLFNSHKYFCINYFIDTDHLEIEEKNIYTATETVTLLPMYGPEWADPFRAANEWAWQYYPHFQQKETEAMSRQKNSRVKRWAEWLLGSRLGDWLDRRAMHLTVMYWQRKFSHYDRGDYGVALKSRRYVSKHHPLFFQKKVLNELHDRMNGIDCQLETR